MEMAILGYLAAWRVENGKNYLSDWNLIDYLVWHFSNKETNTVIGKTTQKHILKHMIEGSTVLSTVWRKLCSHRRFFLGPQYLEKIACILFI